MLKYSFLLIIFILLHFVNSCQTPVQQFMVFKELNRAPLFTNVKDNLLTIESHDGKNDDLTTKSRRDKIREMMLHAWNNYKKYAWGDNELSPLSKKPFEQGVFGKSKMGLTIIDALDTLYIMGFMDEYEEGRLWIQNNFSIDNLNEPIDAFEVSIRIIGSFLSMYALTGDSLFKEKAQYVADKLLPVFDTPTGIPKAMIDLKNNQTNNYDWAYGGSSLLSQYGSFHLEFSYLSEITGEIIYKTPVKKIRRVLENLRKPYDLYPIYINPENGEWGLQYISIGAHGDSFYEYLLKSWIQSGFKDDDSKKMFIDAIDSIEKQLIGKSIKGRTYLGLLKFGEFEPKMDHLACFTGGLFSLAGHLLKDKKYLKLAEEIIDTCHQSYVNSPTGLGPEHFWFIDATNEANALKDVESRFALRPETIESYFYLWRITKNSKYREWGWDFVQSLEQHCRTPNGYSGIKNVYKLNSDKDNIQQSYFLAETLKYLYLLYSDDSVLSLDKWVFNTEGHPLPIMQ